MQEMTDGTVIELPVRVRDMPDGLEEPCDFCSSPEHIGLIRERGHVMAEHRLENLYGETMGFSCTMCIEAAPRREHH